MVLKLNIPSIEIYDEKKEEFIQTKEYNLKLQHSLVSMAKWEAKWEKPFLDGKARTSDELIDYIKCMTITQNIPKSAYDYLSNETLQQIKEHISAPMTATVIGKEPGGGVNNEIYTAEIIYYWMIGLNIPMECQKWHLNRLLTLIRVCNIKNNPPKKMSRQETLARQRRLNAERKAKHNTKG